MAETVEAQVTRAALMLDENKPGWHKLINPETLDLRSSQQCVLGQVYGSFATGVGRLMVAYDTSIPLLAFTRSPDSPNTHGLWLEEVAKRTEVKNMDIGKVERVRTYEPVEAPAKVDEPTPSVETEKEKELEPAGA